MSSFEVRVTPGALAGRAGHSAGFLYPIQGELDLPLLAWEGGPAYWEQFSKADAAGWSSDTFFPISIFLGGKGEVQDYLDLGINTYQAVLHDPPLSDFTDLGLFVIPNYTVTAPDGEVDNGWSVAEVGSNPLAVGWFIYDEAEQGEGVYWDLEVNGGGSGSTENERLAFFQSETQDKRDLADGRFMFANFGNGITGTFWAPTTMADFVQTVDAACVDKYCYTSPNTQDVMEASPNWPGGSAGVAGAYGWMAQQLHDVYDDPNDRRPFWIFIETKMPLLGESGAGVILYDQIEGGIWSAIANEARGIAYFDFNGNYPGGLPVNDPNTGSAHCSDSPALINCEQGLRDRVSQINTRVTELAPVLNTQSYVFDFGATGLDTMLKGKDGYAYIFASVAANGATGSKTFTVTGSGITGTTAEVLYESRSLNVSGGQFSDTFANEYSHHIYKVAI